MLFVSLNIIAIIIIRFFAIMYYLLKTGHNNSILICLRKYENEVFFMEKKKNCSINCSVKQCAHNMETEDYCTLESINVGTHEPDPEVPECTDCNSFVKKSI